MSLYSPDVREHLAESRQLNQSDTASCAIGRSHGYLAATATGVNVSCRTMMDEVGLRRKRGTKNTHTHMNMHGDHGVQRGSNAASGIQLSFPEKEGTGPQLNRRVINRERSMEMTLTVRQPGPAFSNVFVKLAIRHVIRKLAR